MWILDAKEKDPRQAQRFYVSRTQRLISKCHILHKKDMMRRRPKAKQLLLLMSLKGELMPKAGAIQVIFCRRPGS